MKTFLHCLPVSSAVVIKFNAILILDFCKVFLFVYFQSFQDFFFSTVLKFYNHVLEGSFFILLCWTFNRLLKQDLCFSVLVILKIYIFDYFIPSPFFVLSRNSLELFKYCAIWTSALCFSFSLYILLPKIFSWLYLQAPLLSFNPSCLFNA